MLSNFAVLGEKAKLAIDKIVIEYETLINHVEECDARIIELEELKSVQRKQISCLEEMVKRFALGWRIDKANENWINPNTVSGIMQYPLEDDEKFIWTRWAL